ncbi:hypothetical protein ACS0TY_032210 [Phlomoides rotata]
MALKFLNKKGWHTGSLRNIENVWKAEQKHEAEKNKLEELRKQIHEERERAEFRQLQEQAGLISSQERLEFLYDSGLAVGKGSSGFKALESVPKTDPEATASSSTPANQESLVLGALFEEKPQSANDAWRKLHSDPLLMIRQREQEALARIKNNPVKMAMIRKSVETKNKDKDEKKHKKKHHKKKSKQRLYSSSENDSDREDANLSVEKQRVSRHKRSKPDEPSSKTAHTSDEEPNEGDTRRKIYHDKEYKDRRQSGASNSKHHKSEDQQRSQKNYPDEPSSKTVHTSDEEPNEGDTRRKIYHDKEYKDRRQSGASNSKHHKSEDQQRSKKNYYDSQSKEYSSEWHVESHHERRSDSNTSDKPPRHESNNRSYSNASDKPPRHESNSRSDSNTSDKPPRHESNNISYSNASDKPPRHESNSRSYSNTSDKPPRHESNRRRNPVKLSEEERAARLREMQMDAQLHEEQRWKRIKKAADDDAQEAIGDGASVGRNFLDAAHKSIYGAEKGGSSSIEESVRRRTHYSQRGSDGDGNAFRRS